jgi:hypothetical protein
VGYYDQEKMDSLPEAQNDAFMSQCPPFMEELSKSRKMLIMAGVGAEAKVLRRVNGEVAIADGPMSRNEMVGCVFLVEADIFGATSWLPQSQRIFCFQKSKGIIHYAPYEKAFYEFDVN